MKNDKKILATLKLITEKSNGYIDLVESSNPDAYSDRILEEIIEEGKELERLYNENTPE